MIYNINVRYLKDGPEQHVFDGEGLSRFVQRAVFYRINSFAYDCEQSDMGVVASYKCVFATCIDPFKFAIVEQHAQIGARGEDVLCVPKLVPITEHFPASQGRVERVHRAVLHRI